MFRIRQLYAPTLQWYVIREFTILGAVTLLAVTVFFLLLGTIQRVGDFEQFGISVGQMAALAPYFMPGALAQALPPTAMIASIMVFGRMNAENEILAAQAGGASLKLFALPLLVCGGLISAGSLFLQDAGISWANSQLRDEVLQLKKPEEFVQSLDKPGNSFTIQTDPLSPIRINLLPAVANADGTKRRPMQVVRFQGGHPMETVFADDHQFLPAEKGKSNIPVLLTGVQIITDHPIHASTLEIQVQLPDIASIIQIGNTRTSRSWRENWAIAARIKEEEYLRWQFLLRRASDFGALAAASSPLDASSPSMTGYTWNVTRQHSNGIMEQGGALERMKLEYSEGNRKFALGLLPMAMIVLGMGLGLLVKKSNRMIGFLIGVALYCALYYPLTIIAKSLSTLPQLGGYGYAMQYFPFMLFLAGGSFLCIGFERRRFATLPKVLRPSTYFDIQKPIDALKSLFSALWRFIKWGYGILVKICSVPVMLFRYTVERHVATTFLVPFVVIVVCIAGLIIAFDMIEHHAEIVDGIVRCGEPLGGLEIRNEWQAAIDVMAYYGIMALDITLDIVPFEILLAAMLCAMSLVRNQEHLILKSSGMRLQRAMQPVLILAVIACLSVSLTRELVMPTLIMKRDYLKPLVYHRSPQSSSFALYALDEKKKPLLFVIGQYEPATESGKDLCIYLLGEEKNKRIPTITAHFAKYDRTSRSWELWTDPSLAEKAKQSQNPLAMQSSTPRPDTRKKPGTAAVAQADLKRGGPLTVTDSIILPTDVASKQNMDDESLRGLTAHKSQINSWSGPIDPKYINSERPALGVKVLRLEELNALSSQKPAMKVEWFKRITEIMMGVLLLWCTLPLMFNDANTSPWGAIVLAVLFAAIYWGGCEFAATRARALTIPPESLLIPHALFFFFGGWMYFRRLPT